MQVVHTAIVNYNKRNTTEQREQGKKFLNREHDNCGISTSELIHFSWKDIIWLACRISSRFAFLFFVSFSSEPDPKLLPYFNPIDLSEVQVLLLALQVFLTFFTKEIFTANLYYFNLHKAS